MAMTPGTRVGPYEVTTLIGAGGMGEVYRARDTRLARTVAIKFRTLFASGTVNNDGQRFLMFARPELSGENDRNALTVVVNWQAALN
jgi:hypothetical protein